MNQLPDPNLQDSPVLWKKDQIQCLFPLFLALLGSFYMQISTARVFFKKTERERAGSQVTKTLSVPEVLMM